MKNFLKTSFIHRGIPAYLLLGSGLFILVVSFFYLPSSITTAGKSYYQMVSFLLLLSGSLFQLAAFFLLPVARFHLVGEQLPVVSSLCYGFALGMQCYQLSFPLADKLTKVYFFGGNFTLGLVFLLLFLVPALANVVLCFFPSLEKK